MKRELIVRLKGGVGNQLFIYANAFAFSKKYNYELFIDVRSGFVKDSYNRINKLDNISISVKRSTIKAFLFFALRNRSKFWFNLFFKNYQFDIESNPKIYQPLRLTQPFPRRLVIDGLWQSPKYFDEYEKELREELKFTIKLPSSVESLLSSVQNSNAVAIHVRRKNYNNKLNSDYYYNCIKKIKVQIENPRFYVFSDDIDWCHQIFIKEKDLLIVDNIEHSDIVDLFLMSQCKHFIIANSSFSWWGAWLSNNPNKLVFAPEKFKYNRDLYPSDWYEQ